MHIHVFIMLFNSYQRRLKTFMVETHLLLLYRVVAYVRFLGGQQVYIYFHKIRPMALRLQTKETHTVDESISIGCYMFYGLQVHVQHEFCIFVLESWTFDEFFFLQVAYALAVQTCKMSKQQYD